MTTIPSWTSMPPVGEYIYIYIPIDLENWRARYDGDLKCKHILQHPVYSNNSHITQLCTEMKLLSLQK